MPSQVVWVASWSLARALIVKMPTPLTSLWVLVVNAQPSTMTVASSPSTQTAVPPASPKPEAVIVVSSAASSVAGSNAVSKMTLVPSRMM